MQRLKFLAMGVLVWGLMFLGGGQALADDCALLGGIPVGTECHITTPQTNKIGTFNLDKTLRITGTGRIDASGDPGGIVLNICVSPAAVGPCDFILESPTAVNAGQTEASDDAGPPNPNEPNDDASPITIKVSRDMLMNPGSKILAENLTQGGNGGNITIIVGRNLTLKGTSGATPGAVISSSKKVAGGSGVAGNITLTVGNVTFSNGSAVCNDETPIGNVIVEKGSQILADGIGRSAGAIKMFAGENITIDGTVSSKSTLSGTGAVQAPGGGPITIDACCDLKIDDNGVVSSRGGDPGADLVHLEGCTVEIFGLVESTGIGHGIPNSPPNQCNSLYRPDKPSNSTACVEVWAGTTILIDRSGTHKGEINADTGGPGGSSGTSWIDLFANGDITIIGRTSGPFAVHANGNAGTNDDGGDITIKSIAGKVSASGLAIQASATGSGGAGGKIVVEANLDVDVSNGKLEARGATTGGNPDGGDILIRSFGQSIVSNTTSVLDVTGGSPSPEGSVTLTACLTIGFPPGSVIPAAIIPQKTTGACVGAPVLPSYVALPSPDCETICECKGTIVIIKDAIPDSTQDFGFTGTLGSFTLDDDADPGLPNTKTFLALNPGTYSVTETVPFGWKLDSIVCTDPNGNTTVDVATATATIKLDKFDNVCETVTCKFTNTCAGSITIIKDAVPNHTQPFSFTGDLGGFSLIDVGNPAQNTKTFSPLAAGSYVVQEIVPSGWKLDKIECTDPTGNTVVDLANNKVTIALDGCENVTCKFTDIPTEPPPPPECQKQPVKDVLNPTTGRFPGNKGPDLTFRLDLGKDEDGNTSIQQMIDNATDKNADGYIILMVMKDATGIWGGNRTESIVINQNYTKGFGLIGCSVTLNDSTPGDGYPTARITTSAGSPMNIFVMDLHGAGSGVAGWLVEGNGRYMRNVEVINNATGIWFVGNNNTMHNGAAEGNTGVGILIQGSGNKVDSADSFSNGGHGVQVIGNSNQLLKIDAGERGKGNGGDGINVSGNSNVLTENSVFANGGDGIEVIGGSNVLKKNSAGDRGKGNGGDGIRVAGNNNTLDENKASANGGDGFDISGTGNRLKNNRSNEGASGGDKENVGPEYRFANPITNQGGNRKDNVNFTATAAGVYE